MKERELQLKKQVNLSPVIPVFCRLTAVTDTSCWMEAAGSSLERAGDGDAGPGEYPVWGGGGWAMGDSHRRTAALPERTKSCGEGVIPTVLSGFLTVTVKENTPLLRRAKPFVLLYLLFLTLKLINTCLFARSLKNHTSFNHLLTPTLEFGLDCVFCELTKVTGILDSNSSSKVTASYKNDFIQQKKDDKEMCRLVWFWKIFWSDISKPHFFIWLNVKIHKWL